MRQTLKIFFIFIFPINRYLILIASAFYCSALEVKTGLVEWALAYWSRHYLGWSHPILECSDSRAVYTPNSSFLVLHTLGGKTMWPVCLF